MKLKEKLKSYEVKKQKTYTVSETITRAFIYKVRADTEEEALEQVKADNAVKEYEFTTDIFYQIEY